MKQLLTRIILLGGAFCISVSLNSCNEKKAPEKITPHVKVQDIKLSDIPVSYDYPGLLQGVISYNVISRISGVVDKQSYEEGSKVKAGDELYEIDPRPYIAALSQANAQLIKDKTQVNN